MDPPFSEGLHVQGRVVDAAWRHLASAFTRNAPGGRLVAFDGCCHYLLSRVQLIVTAFSVRPVPLSPTEV